MILDSKKGGGDLLRATLPTVGVFLSGHQRQDGLGVVVGLLLARSSRVLAVIGQLVDAAEVADRVTVGGSFRRHFIDVDPATFLRIFADV